MISDASGVPAGSELRADVCVVGAGAAGIALARALGGAGLDVLLLEGGGLQYEAASQDLYAGRSDVGLPYFPLEVARLRYLGGTTGHWAGTCRPFERADFEPRAGVADTGWPIGLEDVEPFYPAAGEVVGLRAGSWELAPWHEHGTYDPLELGPGVVTRVARFADDDDKRLGTRFRGELERARSVEVLLHANVVEVETDPGGSHVERVHVRTLDGLAFTVAARRVVLCCGALENARILLCSDRHQRGGVGNRHDVVGRWFHEHPRFVAAHLVPAEHDLETRFYNPHRALEETIEAYLALTSDVQREHGLLDVQLKLRAVYEGVYQGVDESRDVRAFRALRGERNDASTDGLGADVMHVASDLLGWRRFSVPGAPLPIPYPRVLSRAVSGTPLQRLDMIPTVLGDVAAHTYEKLLGTAPVNHVEVTARLGQQPQRDSRVTLDAERDALGMRRLALDWRLGDLDRESVVRSLELLGAHVGAAGIGRLRMLFGRDDPWPEEIEGGWHQMGTTRMSDDPRRGVVDRDCRVHGIDNLFVAGSSVFATPGAGTPTLTLVALALRLADTLRRELA